MVSTAYSGIPSARATIDRTALSGRPGTRPASSSRIASRVSGSRPRARKLRRPAPQSGRRSSRLRPGEGDDQDRDAATPLEQVVDEVEQARVGPLEVLEQEADRPGRGEPLEERPPCAEQLVTPAARCVADPEQGEQRRFDPASARPRRGRAARPSPRSWSGSWRASSVSSRPARDADHLAERPERDALAVGGRSAVVPPHVLDDPVDVLQELPGQPGLADAGLAGDRDQPRALFAGRRVEQVLEQAQLARRGRRTAPRADRCGRGRRAC